MMCVETEGRGKGQEQGKKDLFQIHRDNDYASLVSMVRENERDTYG